MESSEAVENVATVSINASDYLAQTGVEDSATKTDDIKITTGLRYTCSQSTNMVSILSVFGSTEDIGLYYASNRIVYWINPGPNLGGNLYPTSSSWTYLTDSTEGLYNSNLPPYSLLNCDICISGMTAKRTISVICSLSL